MDTVPNESNSPAERLPDETKGKIAEICQNPVIEEKRRMNHKRAMSMNTYNLKHGKYSKNYPLPDFLTKYINFITDINLKNESERLELLESVIKKSLNRVLIGEHIELSKGSGLDNNVSQLYRDIFVMLQTFGQEVQKNQSAKFDSRDIKLLREDERVVLLEIVRNKLRLLHQNQAQS